MTTSANRYDFVPVLLKRLFTWGILSSALFFGVWYFGGIHVWGYVVNFLIQLVSFFQVNSFYNLDQEAVVFLISLNDSPPVEVGYFANQWNLAICEVILLLSLWWDGKKPKKGILIAACIGLLLIYQVFQVFLHISVQAMGPDLPNQLGFMWEYDGNVLYLALRKLQLFETFIARYWAGFPIFGVAVLIRLWSLGRSTKKKKKTS